MIAKMKVKNGVSIVWGYIKWECTNCIPTGWKWDAYRYKYVIDWEKAEALHSYDLNALSGEERWQFFPCFKFYNEWWKEHKDLELAFDIPSFRLLPASALSEAEAEIIRVLGIHDHHSELENLHTRVYILKNGVAMVYQCITHRTNNRIPTSTFIIDLAKRTDFSIAKDSTRTITEVIFGGGFTDFPPAEYVLRYLEHLPYLLKVEQWISPPRKPAKKRLHHFDETLISWSKIDPDWDSRFKKELEWRKEKGITPYTYRYTGDDEVKVVHL